jgi:hypothetical protein
MTLQRLLGIALATAAIGMFAGGCNREGLPGLGRVTGSVTMDGNAVPNATVMFTPKEAGATASIGRTDDTGKYELYYSRSAKGAKVGEHTVTISDYDESGEEGSRQTHKETIPARYNVKTELTADVKRGTNQIDFPLKAGGEIIQPNAEASPKGKRGARSDTGCS